MIRKIIAAFALSALLVIPVFANGQKEAPKATQTAAVSSAGFNWKANSGTTLKFMADKHPWIDVIRPYLPEFEKMTGIKVAMSVYPESQFRTKRTVEMVSGTSDVDTFMIMPAQDLAKYTQSGWLAPLNGLMTSKSTLWPEYDVADLFPSALKAGVRDGKNYTIPIQLETSLLAYNKDILAKYHVAVPKTMDELLAAAKKIYEDSNGQTYGITLRGKKAAATSQWIDFVHSYGGTWLTSDGKAAIDSPQAIAATDMYGKLLRLYGPKSAPSNSWYESISIFMQGKAAMIYDASVFKAEYENPKNSQVAGHVGYAVIPKGPAGSIPHVSAWSLGIYAGSKHKDAAWQFIQWATSKDMELKGLLKGIPAARNSAWNSPVFKKNDSTPEWTQASLASYKVASPIWNPPVISVGETRDAVGDAIVASILGQNVSKALHGAAKQMDQIIATTH